jgi:SAM-dependent methyltransferase
VTGYGEDLALVHHRGFAAFSTRSAPFLLAALRGQGIRGERVVDLGCGSGLWARALTDAGYEVEGIDQSKAMIRLARRQAPQARFRVGSFLNAPLPPCGAVTALGEVFNYTFDPASRRGALPRLFARAHQALRPGGLFVFDLAGPGRLGPHVPPRDFVEGPGYAVLVARELDAEGRTLTRRITTLMREGRVYRRSTEVHRLRLYPPALVLRELRGAGFVVQTLKGYGRRVPFPVGVTGYLARRR